MKRIQSIFTVATALVALSSCDLTNDGRDTDSEINVPMDRSEYELYNHIFTQGDAVYYGVDYDEQPSDIGNWCIELADDNYNLENYEGEGYNINLEFFCKGTTPAAGTYTIDAFDTNPFSHLSLLYGYIIEDQENGETIQYPSGTWLFAGNYGIAGATDGTMTVAVSGSKYTISYTLHDDDNKITFMGSYSGDLPIYDGTQSPSAAAPQMVSKSAKELNTVKPVRLLRVKK